MILLFVFAIPLVIGVCAWINKLIENKNGQNKD